MLGLRLAALLRDAAAEVLRRADSERVAEEQPELLNEAPPVFERVKVESDVALLPGEDDALLLPLLLTVSS